MSYFVPEQQNIDPNGVADLFSEYLVNSYGKWHVLETLYQHLTTDNVTKVVRNNSLRCYRGDEGWQKGQPLGTDAFFFNFNSPVDCTNLDRVGFMFHAYDRAWDNIVLPTIPILDGYGAVSLQDVNGQAVYTPLFQFDTTQKPWVDADKVLRQYQKSEFTGSTSFDWSKVTTIVFYVGTNPISVTPIPVSGYDIWIDAGPFMVFPLAQPILDIRCLNAQGAPIYNKHAQVTDTNNNVVNQILLPYHNTVQASTYIIKITDSDFLGWGDGTKGDKTITTSAGVTSLTANFVSGDVNPDGGFDLTTIAIVAGAIGIGGLALYYLQRRRK